MAIHHTNTDIDPEVANVTRSGLNIETLSITEGSVLR